MGKNISVTWKIQSSYDAEHEDHGPLGCDAV